MSDFVLCGCLSHGDNEFSELYCDMSNGDIVWTDDLNGNCILSNISVADPIPMEMQNCLKLCRDGGFYGVIMCDSYMIIFRDDTHVDFCKFDDLNKVVDSIEYDTDTEFTGQIDLL